MREKAYKILAQKYRSLYATIYQRCSNARQYGTKEDQLKVLDMILDNKHLTVLRDEDKTIIDTVEYLLDDFQEVK